VLNNSTYRELAQVDSLDAGQALCRLRDAGLLLQKGRGSATYYVPTDSLLDKPVSAKSERLLSESGVLSSHPTPLSSKPDSLSSNPTHPLSRQGGQLNKFDTKKRDELLDGLSGALAAKVGNLGLRHPPQAIFDVVVALCAVRAWRVDELSVVLRRNPEVVRQNYLRPLVREGRLSMTHPQQPNDPQQAYCAVLREGE